MISFNLQKNGRVYVPINIKPRNKLVLSRVEFKVDTGADCSTISKSDLIELGYDMDWITQNVVIFHEENRPTTASGERVNAGYVKLPLINLLGYEGKQWPFQIIMNENQDFRNLLGRDLLTGFNYTFSNDEDLLLMEKTKTFKPRYPFLPDQEIHEIAAK